MVCVSKELDLIIYIITNTASSPMVALAVLIEMFRNRNRGLKLLLIVSSSIFVIEGLKHALMIPRPFSCYFGGNYDGYSMPSGHAYISAAIATYIYNTYNTRKGYIWAIIVSLSRVYLGVHRVSEIVIGFILGIINSTLIKKVKMGYKVTIIISAVLIAITLYIRYGS